jgi:hypothetical protein
VRRATFGLGLAALCCALAGCVMFEVAVTNPVAGLTTVAVAPFFNLSEERSVDGRRFAQAYFTELQKTPGFQVLPVGVVEQAIHDHQLEMNDPVDALRLAQILGVDAVVVGAVTDYSPYYPPRLGLQVSWYSPRPWTFFPGVPTEEWARDLVKPRPWWQRLGSHRSKVHMGPAPGSDCDTAVRGQSAEADATDLQNLPAFEPLPQARAANGALPAAVFDPRQPLMSYTRMFDGADPKLTARLRDYIELHGDLRSGGWEAYLHRSEDFIRFTAHIMVVEMLQLHGGEAKRRVVLKFRKHP